MLTFVTRIPVWNMFWERYWAKLRICLIPTLESGRNSTQIVPMSGGAPSGLAAVGGFAYRFSIVSLGRAENFMCERLRSCQ